MYRWIVWNRQSLGELLSAFPDIVQTKYLVITSFDSGSLSLSEHEQQAGWYTCGDFAHSPQITSVMDLPYDHFDEWYVFQQPTVLCSGEIFINYVGFRLQPDDNVSERAGTSESPGSMRHIQQRFWQQLRQINPESYVADGDNLIFVTRDEALFERIQHSTLPQPERK